MTQKIHNAALYCKQHLLFIIIVNNGSLLLLLCFVPFFGMLKYHLRTFNFFKIIAIVFKDFFYKIGRKVWGVNVTKLYEWTGLLDCSLNRKFNDTSCLDRSWDLIEYYLIKVRLITEPLFTELQLIAYTLIHTANTKHDSTIYAIHVKWMLLAGGNVFFSKWNCFRGTKTQKHVNYKVAGQREVVHK